MKSFVEFVSENIDEKLWYHGSHNDNISIFSTRRKTNRLGIYFSDVEKESKRYGSNIYVVKLHLEKTLNLAKYDEQGFENYENFLDELPIPEKEKDYLKREHKNWGRDYFTPYNILEILDNRFDIIPKLKKKGYDSLKFKEGVGTTMVVFWPSLIEIVTKYKREQNYGW